MRKELLEGLTEEQIKKVESCKNSKEILNLAKEEGVALTDEQLEAVSGGGCFGETKKCPSCGSTKTSYNHDRYIIGVQYWECHECGHNWEIRIRN